MICDGIGDLLICWFVDLIPKTLEIADTPASSVLVPHPRFKRPRLKKAFAINALKFMPLTKVEGQLMGFCFSFLTHPRFKRPRLKIAQAIYNLNCMPLTKV